MKKIMIALIAVAGAFVANAAAVAWNSGTFANGFVGPDGKTLANSTDYTMTVYFYSDAAGETLVTESSVAKAKANGAYNTATTYTDFAAGTTYYAKAIITDGKNEMATDIVAFNTVNQGNSNINFTTGAGLASGAKAWPAAGWSSVPEPTSGLLLLLGVAGLALKRKHA